MHRDHKDAVRRFLVVVEQDHPGPRPDYEPGRSPPTDQLRTGERESFQHPQRAPDSDPGIAGQVECRDRLVYVPLRSRGDDYLRHSGQLVERRPLAASRLGQAFLRPLPCAGDGIEDLRDASRIRICVVERRSEKRTRKSSLLHMSALGEPRELPRVFVIEGHIDALRRRRHFVTVHDSARFVSRVELLEFVAIANVPCVAQDICTRVDVRIVAHTCRGALFVAAEMSKLSSGSPARRRRSASRRSSSEVFPRTQRSASSRTGPVGSRPSKRNDPTTFAAI